MGRMRKYVQPGPVAANAAKPSFGDDVVSVSSGSRLCENEVGSSLEHFVVARIKYTVSPVLRGVYLMKRFIQGEGRSQSTLFPECLEDYIADDNPVRVIEVFVDELDLGKLGFDGVEPQATGRPPYHPSTLLKIYIYGYWSSACPQCKLKAQCTTSIYRRITRWEHEDVLDRMQQRLDQTSEASSRSYKKREARGLDAREQANHEPILF